MPISVIKGNFYDGPIDSFLTLFLDPYYYNSYSGSGATVIDLSGDNDGTLNNVTFDVEQGGSFVFSNNSYIDFPNNQDYYNTGDLTICALVKPTQDDMGQNGGPIISVDVSADGSNYLALVYGTSLYPGKFSWIQRQGTGGALNIPTNILCPSNDWYFVTITRSQSNGTTKMYINGVLDREDVSGITLPTYNLRVGRNKVKSPSGQFLGKISSIRIFIRELSQSEIVNIYNNLRLPPKTLGKSNYSYEPSQNLMVYSNRSLHVDAGEPNSYYISGSTFSDLTGRGINGGLTNSFSGTNPTFSQFNGGYFNFNGFKGGTPPTGNSFIEFNADQLPTGSATSSIITWARCSGYSTANRYIFSYGNPGSAQARYLGVTTTTGKFLVGGFGLPSELTSNTTVTLDEWFQLTFVYTGSSILLYVNGVLDGSKTYTLSTVTSSKKARIGRQITTNGASVDNADGYWFGDISEVIVYDRVLDPQEIYQDYKVKRYRYGLGEVTRPIDNSEATAPTVTTIAITSITTTSALSGVQVVSNGNSNITVSGIIWSTLSTNLTTLLGTKTTGGLGNITGLSPGVTYYVRAYATNAIGTSYGDILSFTSTPIVLPNVIAITASYTGNSAFATGSVTGLGNATFVSARGFVWSTSPINQNTADSIPTRATENGSFVTGEYGLTLSPLNADTLYYVRAFATNTATTAGTTNTPGTTYSSTQLVFKTYAFASVTVPIITNITGISFDASITTTGQLITEQGIIWKTDVSDPNILDDLNNTQPGGAGTYTSTVGSSLNPLSTNTTYYVYGYVKNPAGIAYSTVQIITTDNFALITTDAVITANITNISATVSGSLVNMNGSTVTSIGFVWGDETNFPEPLVDLDITNNTGIYTKTTGIVLGAFNHKITGLSEVTNYYVKAYATNTVGTSYGSAQPFTTFGTPQVNVSQPSFPTTVPDLYNLSGSILFLGGYSPVEVGFQYWLTSTPLSVTTVISTGVQTTTGVFGKKVLLTPTTNYSVRSYVKYPLGTIYSNTITFQTQAGLPSLTTTSISAITSTSANSGGNVTSDGGTTVTARGLVYDTSPNPTTGNLIVSGGSGTGEFASNITGLTPNTTYYIRAYASNFYGTTYGNEVTFTTSASTVPVVASTTPVTSIGQTTAISGGNISSDGGSPVTARGVVWSTSANPTTSNSKTTDGTGIDTFTSTISGLSPKTTYYVRAYATNVNGTTYGTQTSFATIDVPELTTTAISNLTNNSAQSGGSISTDNGSAITAKGVVWSTNQNPTIALTTKTSNGAGSSNFTSNLTSLSPSTTYYVRAYATNAAGTGYGNQVILTTSTVPTVFTNITISNITDNDAQSGGTVAADGASTVTARGVVWSTSTNPTVTLPTKTIDGTDTGPFTSVITGLTGNTTYYVKAYATNANGTSYGSEVSFTTTTIPTLTTSPVINVSTTFATSGGVISSDGGVSVTARGVCWSTSPNPTIALSTKTSDGTGTGTFTSNITGLTLNTTYYVRAYATNANGTAYGAQVSFTTLSTILPVITNFARRTTVQSFGSTLPGEPTCASTLGSISAIALFDFDVNVASGGNPITESGIVSNTSPNPTINNYINSVFDSGTQFLTRGIGGLAGSQNLWYFRAYSYNGSSYVYSSNTVIFAVPDLIMDNLVLSNGGLTWTATAHISNLPSGFSVISKGFRWGIDTTYNNVSTSPYLAGTLNGANAPSFQAVVSGADLDYSYTLSPVIHTGLYWVKAWVQISNGTTNYKCWSGESTARTIEI
jgi:hypothetical protein